MKKDLKVGEKVAVYDRGQRIVCWVCQIFPDDPEHVKVDAGNDDGPWHYSIVHVEQIRQFKKDRSAVIWIRESDDLNRNEEFLSGQPVKIDVATHYARQGSHWIKYIRAKNQSS